MLKSLLDKDISTTGYKVQDVAKYGLAGYLGYKTLKYAYWRYRNRQVRALGAKVRQARDSQRYEFREIANAEQILGMDVTQLKEGLRKGEFTSVDLIHVFGQRCYTIGRKLNLSAEENFEEALKEAQIKD